MLERYQEPTTDSGTGPACLKAKAVNLARRIVGMIYFSSRYELVFEVIQEFDGGYVAECAGETLFRQAENWEEFRRNVREVVSAYYSGQPENIPSSICLHLVRDEVLLTA